MTIKAEMEKRDNERKERRMANTKKHYEKQKEQNRQARIAAGRSADGKK